VEEDGFEPSVPLGREQAEKSDQIVSTIGLVFTGDRGFESVSLQQRVRLSLALAFVSGEPRLSARVCAADIATGSAETRSGFRFRAKRRRYLCRAYSSTAAPLMWSARTLPWFHEARPSRV